MEARVHHQGHRGRHVGQYGLYRRYIFFIQKRAGDSRSALHTRQYLCEYLLAGITAAFHTLVARIEDAFPGERRFYLMEALPTLADIARYGDTRQTDVEAVKI